jgi:hypothetical protein
MPTGPEFDEDVDGSASIRNVSNIEPRIVVEGIRVTPINILRMRKIGIDSPPGPRFLK